LASVWGELKRRNVVRVAIAYAVGSWLILQLTDVLAPLLELPDWVARFVLFLLIIGFLVTLILAWVFELTPEGLKLEKDVDRSQSITRTTGRKLDFTIIGISSIALAMFALDRFLWSPTEVATADATMPATEALTEALSDEPAEVAAAPDNTIAVLPFVNMSSDAEQEYFSDGLSEELLNLLVRIPELRVTSRTSAFFYKGKDIQIADVGRELDVAYIMEGSVRRAGDTIRVTAQLIDVGTDTHIWSDTWDREFSDVFAIQDEIAAAVVDAMKVSILNETPQVAETDPEAYAFYLQARSFYSERSADGAHRAAEALEKVFEIDNKYAPAWAMFGEVYRNGSYVGAWEPHEAYPAARAAALEALKHDENSAEAHYLLSRIASDYDYDVETAWTEIQIASELAPGNNRIRARRALFSVISDEEFDRVAELQRALHADPLNSTVRMGLGFTYMYNDRVDEAIETFREARALDPNIAGVHFRLAQMLTLNGEYDVALELLEDEVREGFRVAGRAFVFQAQGNTERSAEELQRLIDLGNVWTYEIASVYAFREELDEAFLWLDRAMERRDQGLGAIMVDPFMVNLYDDPRFDLVMEQMGRTDVWAVIKERRGR
jgi:TolB-like protein